MTTEKNTQDIPRSESVYLRILQEIEHEIKYGREDCTKDLTCLIDRYTERYGPQDGRGIEELEKKLEEYKAAVKRRTHERGQAVRDSAE